MARADEGGESLASFVSAVGGVPATRVEESLGDGFWRLDVNEAERRQARHDIRDVEDAVIELLRNARDAHAGRIYVASTRQGSLRRIVVLDDGSGIPEPMHERIFEPRVTSKLDTMVMDSWGVHGRGMALYSIRENAVAASVRASAPGLGTAISAEFDTERVRERRDQSKWPVVVQGDEGPELVGPHNILRTISEFTLEAPPSLDVYVGSPAEIIATMRQDAKEASDESALIFATDLSILPLGQRLLAASDAHELEVEAGRLGLDISERTAHRILAGSIRPVRSVQARLRHGTSDARGKATDLGRDRRGLRISEEDKAEMARRLGRAFEPMAGRYFLRLRGTPSVSVTADAVRVTFHVAKEDEG